MSFVEPLFLRKGRTLCYNPKKKIQKYLYSFVYLYVLHVTEDQTFLHCNATMMYTTIILLSFKNFSPRPDSQQDIKPPQTRPQVCRIRNKIFDVLRVRCTSTG